MKTVVKRINPAFTVLQPLPVWPVAIAHRSSIASERDHKAASARIVLPPEAVEVAFRANPVTKSLSRDLNTN